MKTNTWDKKKVLAWFGDRGVILKPQWLKAWHWEDGKLTYIIAGAGDIDTEDGFVDITQTHRVDGTPILDYELYDSIPIGDFHQTLSK